MKLVFLLICQIQRVATEPATRNTAPFADIVLTNYFCESKRTRLHAKKNVIEVRCACRTAKRPQDTEPLGAQVIASSCDLSTKRSESVDPAENQNKPSERYPVQVFSFRNIRVRSSADVDILNKSDTIHTRAARNLQQNC